MINLLFLCFSTACLSLFIEICFDAGMVLHWYYKRIEKLPEVLFKPLGGCIYCFGAWVYIIISCILCYKSGVIFDFIGLFLGLGFNFIFIKALERYVV